MLYKNRGMHRKALELLYEHGLKKVGPPSPYRCSTSYWFASTVRGLVF